MRTTLVVLALALWTAAARSQDVTPGTPPERDAAPAAEPGPVAPSAQPKEPSPGTAAQPWRWGDREEQPSQPWHTDAELHARLLQQAQAELHAELGIELSTPVEIVLTPSHAFALAAMEIGAKDGSLLLDTSITRAIQHLAFMRKADRKAATISTDWCGDPGSVLSLALGMYVPKHVKRTICLVPGMTPEKAGWALKHELVHAMQDELFPFSEHFAFDGITVDGKWARQAVEEGFAMLMVPAGQPSAAGTALAGTDPVAGETRVQLDQDDRGIRQAIFFYGNGRELVERVSGRSASRRDLLDLVFERAPSTTREVLHPELYERVLESGESFALPEPADFVVLREALVAAMTAAGRKPAWQSRLGEFGLQCVLVEMGMPEAEAQALASSWRNDAIANHDALAAHHALANHGEWRQPDATSLIVSLEGAESAQALEQRFRELIGERSGTGLRFGISLAGQRVEAWQSSDNPAFPDAFVARHGASVALIVGDGLAALAGALQGS
jgi:hypothetical protein